MDYPESRLRVCRVFAYCNGTEQAQMHVQWLDQLFQLCNEVKCECWQQLYGGHASAYQIPERSVVFDIFYPQSRKFIFQPITVSLEIDIREGLIGIFLLR